MTSKGNIVLDIIRNAGTHGVSVTSIQFESGFGSGTLYPILLALERGQVIVSEWTTYEPRVRIYRIANGDPRNDQE